MFYQFNYLRWRAWRKKKYEGFLLLGSCNFLVLRGEAFLQTLLPEKVVWWSNPLRKYCFCLQHKSRELVFHPSSSLSSYPWGRFNAQVLFVCKIENEVMLQMWNSFSVDRMNLFNLFILLYSYMEGKLNLCDFTTIFWNLLTLEARKALLSKETFKITY